MDAVVIWSIGLVMGITVGIAAMVLVAASLAQSVAKVRAATSMAATADQPRLNVLQWLLVKAFILVWALIAAAGGGEK